MSQAKARREVMSVQEAADFLHIGLRTLQRLVERRDVPHVRIGRKLLFLRGSLMDWLKDLQTRPTGLAGAVDGDDGPRRRAGKPGRAKDWYDDIPGPEEFLR